MTIGGISPTISDVSNINASDTIKVKMLDKALEMNEDMGQGMVNMMEKSMMEQAVNPNLGKNIDLFV